MGAMQNNPDTSGRGGKKRGTTRNADRLAVFARGGGGSGADWGDCDPERIQWVITGITSKGGAVTFGLSRDRGAHFMTLLLDNGKQTLWYNGDANLDDELKAVVDHIEAMD